MRHFKRKRGFLTFAQNGKDDYLRMAYGLALSLKASQTDHSHLSVVITPGTKVPDTYKRVFDEIIDVPWVDEARDSEWKLENEWKAFHITPYEETIKLDADMLFTTDVTPWWDHLARQDVWCCTNAETYRRTPIVDDTFRKVFTANKLPNAYTAFMYFKANEAAQEIFSTAETIFHNWQKFFFEFLDDPRPTQVSTDVVFALAMKLCDPDSCTFSSHPIPRFVHMKTGLQDWPERTAFEQWTKNVPVSLTDDLKLKVGRFFQVLPFHYQDKNFLTDDILKTYEKALGL